MKQSLVPYNLRLPVKLKRSLERQAKEEKRSLNQFLVLKLEKMEMEAAAARQETVAATA